MYMSKYYNINSIKDFSLNSNYFEKSKLELYKTLEEKKHQLKLKKIHDNFINEKSQLFPINRFSYKGDYLTVYNRDYVSYNDELSKIITKDYQDKYTAKLSKSKYIPKS